MPKDATKKKRAAKGTKPRNPKWNREELILALDAYIRWSGKPPKKSSDEIAALSTEIGNLRRSLGSEGDKTLRNVNGVYMKLMNFRRVDPVFQNQAKVGLRRGNKLEKVVWDEFAEDLERLRQDVGDIRANLVTNGSRKARAQTVAPSADGLLDERLETIARALPPERREYIRELMVRNRRHVAKLKKLYGGRCQVSGNLVLDGIAGDITEAHHIEWLTRGGLDTKENMVVLAPDVHAAIHAADAMFDWSDLSFVINGCRFTLALNKHLKPSR